MPILGDLLERRRVEGAGTQPDRIDADTGLARGARRLSLTDGAARVATVGQQDDRGKAELLARAKALLAPID